MQTAARAYSSRERTPPERLRHRRADPLGSPTCRARRCGAPTPKHFLPQRDVTEVLELPIHHGGRLEHLPRRAALLGRRPGLGLAPGHRADHRAGRDRRRALMQETYSAGDFIAAELGLRLRYNRRLGLPQPGLEHLGAQPLPNRRAARTRGGGAFMNVAARDCCSARRRIMWVMSNWYGMDRFPEVAEFHSESLRR